MKILDKKSFFFLQLLNDDEFVTSFNPFRPTEGKLLLLYCINIYFFLDSRASSGVFTLLIQELY